jgi:hypothetical protein
LAKASKTYFLTSYMEYLLKSGIKSEEDHLGDASRFLRYLLSRTQLDDFEGFCSLCNASTGYRRRLKRTLMRFFLYTQEELGVSMPITSDLNRLTQ